MNATRTNRTIFLATALFAVSAVAGAQWKTKSDEKVPVSESLVRTDNGGLLFGWFDPARLTMHHSFSLSYVTAGDMGLSLGQYTNTMMYQISDPLSIRVDMSLTQSPYDSYGGKLGKELSGFRISNAELNYRPSENTYLRLQFRQLPPSPYLRGFNSYGSGFGYHEYMEPFR